MTEGVALHACEDGATPRLAALQRARPEPVRHAERRLLPDRHRAVRAPGRRPTWKRRRSRAWSTTRFELTYDELLAMPMVEEPVTISCVSNEVGGDLVGNAVWRGVPLPTLLERAGVQPGRHPDRRPIGRRLHRRLPDRAGARRPHGAGRRRHERRTAARRTTASPPDSIVAGLYGYVSATKWLKRDRAHPARGLRRLLGAAGLGQGRPDQDRVAHRRPPRRRPVAAGRVAGRRRGLGADTGASARSRCRSTTAPWQPAELGEVASKNTWVQWLLRVAGDARTPPAVGACHRRHRRRCRPRRAAPRRLTERPVITRGRSPSRDHQGRRVHCILGRPARACRGHDRDHSPFRRTAERAANRSHGMAQHRAPHPG